MGSGIGLWGSYFLKHEIDYLALDGDWIEEEKLLIPKDMFRKVDLTKKLDLDQMYDIVLCLEVAEHIDNKFSDTFVDNITRHGETIIFSAAIPGQGGFRHVNEQFQSYWIKKFEDRGYMFLDVLRPLIWMNQNVRYYYQQNIMTFIKFQHYQDMGGWSYFKEHLSENAMTSVVHPELYQYWRDPKNYSMKGIIKNIPYYIKSRLFK